MAKKETSPELTEEFKKTLEMTKFLDIEVDDELKRSFIAYAMAVNKSRAIPDVRDGLKPVHRRILYSMHEMGLYNDKAYRKCARIVGDCLGKYHPHGDSSVYDALVRLAQEFTINFPLVYGHGNFGSIDGDGAAAMRYTEAKLTKLAAEMLKDLDKETVDFIPNFDATEEEKIEYDKNAPGKVEYQRYKGLGEMSKEQLWDTTMNPETRTLIRVTMKDAAEADQMFAMLMGENPSLRRQFIEENASLVTDLDV